MELDPEKEAQIWAARGIIKNGQDLVERGKVKETIEKYSETLKLYPTFEIPASAWNQLCWFGCLWGYHTEVMVKSACKRAAEIEPENGHL